MEKNPFYRRRDGELPDHEALLLRNVWIPQFTETTELIQSTAAPLGPTSQEGMQRSVRQQAAHALEAKVMTAVLRPHNPVDAVGIGELCRTIERRHIDIVTARSTAIAQSLLHENANKLEEAVEMATETSMTYFRSHRGSALEEPVTSGLRAQFVVSQAMLGIEEYLKDNLAGEQGAGSILDRLISEVAALQVIRNRTPLRFIARDIQLYRNMVGALNQEIADLHDSEDYRAMIEANKELRQVLRQLKVYAGK